MHFLVQIVFSPEIKKKVQYVPYTMMPLFAEVGGFLGIFLGFSTYDLIAMIVQLVLKCTGIHTNKGQAPQDSGNLTLIYNPFFGKGKVFSSCSFCLNVVSLISV